MMITSPGMDLMKVTDPNNMALAVSNGVRRLALLTACATALLLFIGGLVTSKGAGLAVPDWPTTFGHNMFLYPWSGMVGGVFYEHGHRLFASAVGLLTVLLALLLWIREPRRWVRGLGLLAVVLVIVQGILGGLRVIMVEQNLAIIHGCVASAFFALLVSLVLFTSREWAGFSRRVRTPGAGRVQRLALFTTGLIYLQIVFGAVLRYTGSLLEGHLLLAFLVVVHVALLANRIHRIPVSKARLSAPAAVLGCLLILQLGLGLGSYVGKFGAFGWSMHSAAWVTFATTHVVVGALMLATSLIITLRAHRYLGSCDTASDPGLTTDAKEPGKVPA